MNSMNSHIDKIQSSILNAYKIGITLGNPGKFDFSFGSNIF